MAEGREPAEPALLPGQGSRKPGEGEQPEPGELEKPD